MSQKVGLKRLGFVEAYTKATVDIASDVYGSAKVKLLPAFLKARVEQAEQLASDYSTPAYRKLLSGSHELLTFADAKVDSALITSSKLADNVVHDVKHIADPQAFKSQMNKARARFAANTDKGLEFFKAHGLVGSAKYLAGEGATTTRKVIDSSFAHGKNLASSARKSTGDAVHYAFIKIQAFVEVASKKYSAAHDAVVKQPMYKDAYERTNHIVTAAQDTKVYKTTINCVYPIVAPVYNPAYQKIEPYYKSTVNYWKPVTAAA